MKRRREKFIIPPSPYEKFPFAPSEEWIKENSRPRNFNSTLDMMRSFSHSSKHNYEFFINSIVEFLKSDIEIPTYINRIFFENWQEDNFIDLLKELGEDHRLEQ